MGRVGAAGDNAACDRGVVISAAVLSDIHGVLPVLEAVLAESEVRAADLIVVTGDHASGPQPRGVLGRLVAEADRVRLVRGNADRELVALRRDEDIQIPDDITPWAAGQLTETQVNLLTNLPHPLVLDVDGYGPIVFCHGSPRRDDEIVLVDSPLSRWQAAFTVCLRTIRRWSAATPTCHSFGSSIGAW